MPRRREPVAPQVQEVIREAGSTRSCRGRFERLALASPYEGVREPRWSGGPHQRYFDPGRNYLGSATAHAPPPQHVVGGGCRCPPVFAPPDSSWKSHPDRAVAVVGCIVMASPLSLCCGGLQSPLQLLQFPWRWLLPATLLLAPALTLFTRASVGRARVYSRPFSLHGLDSMGSGPRPQSEPGVDRRGSDSLRVIGCESPCRRCGE